MAACADFDAATKKGDEAEIKRASVQVSPNLEEFGRAKFRYEEAARHPATYSVIPVITGCTRAVPNDPDIELPRAGSSACRSSTGKQRLGP